jgi:hypothetical protein
VKQNFVLAPYPSTLGQFWPHGCIEDLLKKDKENESTTHFEQKFTMGSYGVGI